MILLDTGIISEAMKPSPDPVLVDWLDAQRAESLYICTITVGELLSGIGSLPKGSSKDGLAKALEGVLQMFSGRMLTFDTVAAFAYADLSVQAKRKGKSHSFADAFFAAIAAGHGLTVASRNPAMYESFGLRVIDPGGSATS